MCWQYSKWFIALQQPQEINTVVFLHFTSEYKVEHREVKQSAQVSIADKWKSFLGQLKAF